MLDVAWPELMVIGVVALVAIGPKDLPRVMFGLGRFAGKCRRVLRDLQMGFEQLNYEAEVAARLKQVEAAAVNKEMDMSGKAAEAKAAAAKAAGAAATGGGKPIDQTQKEREAELVYEAEMMQKAGMVHQTEMHGHRAAPYGEESAAVAEVAPENFSKNAPKNAPDISPNIIPHE